MIEASRGRTKIQLENEWCVENYMNEGYSREEAKEKCAEGRRTGRTGDTHVSGRRVAHDSEDPNFMACVEWRMGEGDSRKEAEEYCRENQEENKRYAEQGPKFPASDSLGIVGREATTLERCMSCRMDIYGEDEETARRTCTKMFNDPMMRHTFTEGDSWAMGAALFRWDYDHSPKWAGSRERDRQEQKSMDRKIKEIIKEIQSDSKDPDRFLPDISLKERAERIYRQRQEDVEIKVAKKAREENMTVGNLYGKTKEQIIRAQAADTSQTHKDIYRLDTDFRPPKSRSTVGSLYMKTREQIIAEDQGHPYPQWSLYPEKKREYDKCVRERMAEGWTREAAEAHCLAATLPSDEPGPHAKPLRKGPM